MQSRLLIPLVVLVGVGITAACFYPGYLSGDSNWQYQQAREGVYSDWHPVMTAFVWRGLDRLIEGSGGLFLLTAAIFWTGLALSIRPFSRSLVGFLVPVFFLGALYTPSFAMLSQVGKDALMGATLLLGFALVNRANRSASLPAALCALVTLWFAISLRHNAAAAVLPLALWLGMAVARHHFPSHWRSTLRTPLRGLATGLALFTVLLGAAQLTSSAILGASGTRSSLHQLIAVYDIVGISVRSDHSYLPSFYWQDETPYAEGGRPYSVDELRAIYHPQSNFDLHWGDDETRRLILFTGSEGIRALWSAWLDALRAEPSAYLRHRFCLFLSMLGWLPDSPLHGIHFDVQSDYAYHGPRVFGLPHNRWLVETLTRERGSVIFDAWIYALLGLACMAFAGWQRSVHIVPVSVLGASALAYLLPYLFVGVDADFRYVWWPVLASLVQVIIVLDGLGRSEGSPAETLD